MRFFRYLLSKESLFFCFLFSGSIKTIVPNIEETFDLTTIFLAMTLLAGVSVIFKTKQVNKKTIAPFLIFVLLGTWMLISLIFSPGETYATEKTMKFIVLTGWSFMGSFLFLRNKDSLKRFIISGYLITFAVCLIAFVQFSAMNYTYDMIYTNNIRAGNENTIGLARFAGINIIIAACILIYTKTKVKFFILLSLSVPLYILTSTATRAPVLALCIIVGALMLSGFSIKKNDLKINKGLLPLLISMLAVFIFALINRNHPTLVYLVERFKGIFNSNLDASSLERTQRFDVALDMFSKSPFFGTGVGSYPIFNNEFDIRSYPHNIFLEIVAELGFVGLFIFVSLLVVTLYRLKIARKTKTLNMYHFSVIMIAFYMFVNSNISGDINDNRTLFALIAILCVKLPAKEIIKKTQDVPLINNPRAFNKY